MSQSELAVLPDSSATDAVMVQHFLAPARRSEATVRAYTAVISEFQDYIGHIPLNRVNVEVLGSWLNWIIGRNLGHSALEQRVAVIRGLLSQCHAAFPALYQVNVSALQSFRPPRHAETGVPRVLSREQVVSLILGEQDARCRVMLAFLYATGLRISELLAAKWEDFVWEDARGDAVGRWTLPVLGKGQKWRTVDVPDWLWEMLEPGEGRIFPISRQRAWVIVKRSAKRAGLNSVSPHWLRHACGSHALEAGATAVEVQQLLGHSNLSTTSRYLHATRGRVVAEALKMGVDNTGEPC